MRLDGQYMIVTPSGIDYRRLRPEDMVKVDIRSLQYEGELKPTSEKEYMAAFTPRGPEINAVIHTHSKYCCVFAAARRPVPVEDDRLQPFLVRRWDLPDTGCRDRQLQKNTLDALGK